MKEKRVGNAKQRKENDRKAVKCCTAVWKRKPVKDGEKRNAGDFRICRAKAERAWKAVCSVLSGMTVELYLDHRFLFPHGLEWLPALVMLGICLSILAAVLLEGAERFLGKIRRTVQVYEMVQSAKEISSQISRKNGCSFSKNACILGDECREALAHSVCSGKRLRKVVAFSGRKQRRKLRNVC